MNRNNLNILLAAVAFCVPFQVILLYFISFLKPVYTWMVLGKLTCGIVTESCTMLEFLQYSINGTIIGFLFYNLVFFGLPTLASIIFLFIAFKIVSLRKRKS